MKLLVAAAALAMLTGQSFAAAHHCADDARQRAMSLLSLHFSDNDPSMLENQNLSIGDDVKQLSPIKALKGKGKFDVLEVWGYIYKAEYRMHFIYAQIEDSCVLMGQEILEASDPY